MRIGKTSSPGKAINYSVYRARQLNPQFLAGPSAAWARWPQRHSLMAGEKPPGVPPVQGSTGRFKRAFIQTLNNPRGSFLQRRRPREAENPQRVVVGLG